MLHHLLHDTALARRYVLVMMASAMDFSNITSSDKNLMDML